MMKLLLYSVLGLLGTSSMIATTPLPSLKVAVFCSADDKVSASLKEIAYRMGKQLALNHYGLITGGSRTGLMKEVVDGYVAAAQNLDNLYGIMPQVLASYDVHHRAISPHHMLWVETLHIRLATFHTMADAVIVLPGGIGTLHELLDFMVHKQFALTTKPIILVNPHGYWDSLLAQFQTMVTQQLVSAKHLGLIEVVQTEQECLAKLASVQPGVLEQGLISHYWER